MDEKEFRAFLKAGKAVPPNLSAKVISTNVRMAKEFEEFLKSRGKRKQISNATERDMKAFVRHLAEDGRNTFDNLIGVFRYARFVGNQEVTLAILIMLDGANILEELCKTVRRERGKAEYDEMLGDFVSPEIGTSPKLMPRATSDFMDRVESRLGDEDTREILLTGPHAAPPEYHMDERKMLRSSRSIDEYLRKRREKFINELQSHMENGTLFFTQPIDQDVMDFVRKNPEVAGGVRRGNKIYLTKVPYMAIEVLKEKDPKMRRYYYCHCPLARESILSGKEMSRNLCYCSAGYEKRPFDVAFGQSTNAKVLKSVLWGDPICRFSIEIPEKMMKKKS